MLPTMFTECPSCTGHCFGLCRCSREDDQACLRGALVCRELFSPVGTHSLWLCNLPQIPFSQVPLTLFSSAWAGADWMLQVLRLLRFLRKPSLDAWRQPAPVGGTWVLEPDGNMVKRWLGSLRSCVPLYPSVSHSFHL